MTQTNAGPTTENGAPPPDLVPNEHTLATIHRWLDYRLWHTRTPGAQVAIGLAGQPFFSRAYGWADLERRVPMRTDHLFRIASHSKTFTATVVLQLVERGRLGLDDPIGRHLPQLDPTGPLAGIRVRELLEHTAGVLRDGLDAGYWEFRRAFPDTAALLDLAREGGTKFAPGQAFAYSNVGYSLLGLVIEQLTGTTFAEAAHASVVAPLGLLDTAADYLPERAEDYAAGHSGLHTGTRRQVLPHVDTAAMAAATGFTSTARDLVSYFAAHAFGDERLLSDRTKRLMQRQANATNPQAADDPGYGWGMIVDHVDDQTYVGHSGGYPGHITKTLLDPTTGLVICVLTNGIDGPATPLARGVAQLLAEARTLSGDGPPSARSLARTGRYVSTWGVIDLAVLGGGLRALRPTAAAPLEDADELEEDGDGLRIAAGNGFGSVRERVRLTDDPAGGAASLRYGGMEMRAWPQLDGSPEHRRGAS